jgi:hypothetical protein
VLYLATRKLSIIFFRAPLHSVKVTVLFVAELFEWLMMKLAVFCDFHFGLVRAGGGLTNDKNN